MDFFANLLKGKSKDTRDEIAEILKVDKGALDAFNESYAKHALDGAMETDNFFDVNSRQAAGEKAGIIQTNSVELDDIINRIVMELISKARIWSYDGSVHTWENVLSEKVIPVTNDEIKTLPEEIRPQLTGSLSKVDISEPAYKVLLSNYISYVNEKNLQKKQIFYHMFRQGLDILDIDDITYKIIGTNPNSIGYWLPNIVNDVVEHGYFKIPKTTILKVPQTMLQLTRLDYMELTRTTLDIVDQFCHKVFSLDDSKDYFIKTGTYSSKFDFRNALVHGEKEVRELGEYLLFIHFQACMMASPLTKPCIYGVSTTNEWVVREFIHDVEYNPTIYKGLPLHTEYRAFVDFDTDELLGITPYWDSAVMKQRFGHEEDADSPHNIHDYIIYCAHEEKLMKRYYDNVEMVKKNLLEIIPNIDLPGQWSVDIMQNGDDFWIIDMATAATSALNGCVPKDKLIAQEEQWIPAQMYLD